MIYGNARASGEPRGLQIRCVPATVGIGGFDSHTFPLTGVAEKLPLCFERGNNGVLKKIPTLDAVFIVLMAATGLAVKPVIGPVLKMIAAPFFLSTGSIAGVVYMVFPLLSVMVTRQSGSATLTGFIQGIIVSVSGIYGSHGVLSLLSYGVPCIFMDMALMVRYFRHPRLIFFPPALANAVGSLLVGTLFLRLPEFPLIVSAVLSFISGGFSGYLALFFYSYLLRHFPALVKEGEFLIER